METFIKDNFNVIQDEAGNLVIAWDEFCRTDYNSFIGYMFGVIVQTGLDNLQTRDAIIKSMINESIVKNFGLTEYIIRHTGISLL
jgi:hypothetical protein